MTNCDCCHENTDTRLFACPALGGAELNLDPDCRRRLEDEAGDTFEDITDRN